MYSIDFSEAALKQLNKIEGGIQERILNVLERITARPFHFVKRKEGTPHFILRIGEYRAILDIREEKAVIFVIELGHRKNIYNF